MKVFEWREQIASVRWSVHFSKISIHGKIFKQIVKTNVLKQILLLVKVDKISKIYQWKMSTSSNKLYTLVGSFQISNFSFIKNSSCLA